MQLEKQDLENQIFIIGINLKLDPLPFFMQHLQICLIRKTVVRVRAKLR